MRICIHISVAECKRTDLIQLLRLGIKKPCRLLLLPSWNTSGAMLQSPREIMNEETLPAERDAQLTGSTSGSDISVQPSLDPSVPGQAAN